MVASVFYVLFLPFLTTSVSASLPGSCVAAGYTKCCVSGDGETCNGYPPFCLCDPSCHEFDDCCDDIADICNPESPPPPPAPILLLVLNVTFHSATLLWVRPTNASLNDTYTVWYWSSNGSQQKVGSSEILSSDQLLQTIVSNMSLGTAYQWTVEATNSAGSTRSLPSNFSTNNYVPLEGFKVQLLNSSAAFVSWLPPILPIGIRLVNYTIYHVRVVYGGESSNTRIQNSTFLVDHGTVGQLDSDQLYEFWGEAVIKETDGSTTIGAITQRNATIFIPDSTAVQIRGGPFRKCQTWTEETEIKILNIFRYMVMRAIHGSEECKLHKEQIVKDIVFCESNSLAVTANAVYRAIIYTTPNHTASQIQSHVQQFIREGDLSGDALLSVFQVDTTCPVKVDLWSQPLCHRRTENKPTECPKLINAIERLPLQTGNCSCQNDKTEGVMVPVPIVVAAMGAELALMVVFLLIILLTLMVLQRRRHTTKTVDHIPATSNVYS